jgi:hypothetical protein
MESAWGCNESFYHEAHEEHEEGSEKEAFLSRDITR